MEAILSIKESINGFFSPSSSRRRGKDALPINIKTFAAPEIQILDALPKDVIIHALTFLEIRDTLCAARVCKRFKEIIDQEQLWRRLCVLHLPASLNSKEEKHSWKEHYLLLHNWKFSEDEKAEMIALEQFGTTCVRTAEVGTNPCVRVTRPITSHFNYFQVKILDKGRWLSIGLQEKQFPLNNGKVCGSGEDKAGFNCGYYSGGNRNHYVKMNGVKVIDSADGIEVGDEIGILVNKLTRKITFYHNGTPLQEFEVPEKLNKVENSSSSWDDILLYPACSLGGGAKVSITRTLAPPPRTN